MSLEDIDDVCFQFMDEFNNKCKGMSLGQVIKEPDVIEVTSGFISLSAEK